MLTCTLCGRDKTTNEFSTKANGTYFRQCNLCFNNTKAELSRMFYILSKAYDKSVEKHNEEMTQLREFSMLRQLDDQFANRIKINTLESRIAELERQLKTAENRVKRQRNRAVKARKTLQDTRIELENNSPPSYSVSMGCIEPPPYSN